MPHLHYSNQLENLVEPLARELDKRDPFECVDIVVPNYSLEKWISIKIAQKNGIAVNLRFVTLEKAIYEGFEDKLKEKKVDLLKKETIQCLLLENLRKKLENLDPLWLPLRNYLSPKTVVDHQAKELRLFQLSHRLAHLFQEYEFSRNEEIINSWLLGKNSIDMDPLGTERWQKELWIELFGTNGKIDQHNQKVRESFELRSQPELYSLTQLYRMCHAKSNQENSKSQIKQKKYKKSPLHVFGISYLSQFHQKSLTDQLSQFREINVYSLNPCMEFWEDVQSLSESKAEILNKIESKSKRFPVEKNLSEKELLLGEEFQFEEDNPFLQAWGRPGRENIRLLNQWSNWDFNPWFVENNPSKNSIVNDLKILNQLQQDILYREPRRLNSLEMTQDDSIVILACPNPRREVEAIASLIWDWIKNEPDLRLNECALIVHDMNIYQPEIEHVFENIFNLPFHLIDGYSGIANRLEEAVKDLLGLCFTEYSREDLFNLINNPFFINKFEDITTEDYYSFGESLQTDKWIQWADDLNVFYGIDNKWHEDNGYEHLKHGVYSWEQAFRRLTLGDFISCKNENEIFSIANNQIVPANNSQEWSIEAARFMLIVRSLIEDTRHLPKWEMTAKNWGRYLHILLKTYLDPSEKINDEAFQNLLRNALSISDLDLGQEPGHLFKFDTILEFFKQKQSNATMHRGHYLADGITVSSFQPMRPIPFKAVFVLGLGEGLFPSTFTHDTLDLRHISEKIDPPIEGKIYRERRIGDVSPAERDRYMFLETLISTRKHLVLSYVSHNDRNDNKLNPSPIIQTLVDELDGSYLKNKFIETQHPLKPYSLNYFPELICSDGESPVQKNNLPNYNFSAFNHAKSLMLRELFDQKFPGFEIIPKELLSSKINNFLKNDLLPKTNLNSGKEITTFSITNLRRFLESPSQTTIRHLISFNEEEGINTNEIEEPFFLERLNEWSLLRKVWNNALDKTKNSCTHSKIEPEWDRFYLPYAKRMELEGLMPTSIFKKAMQEKHIRILNNWQKNITETLQIDWLTLQKNLHKFHFGPLKKESSNSELTKNNLLRPTILIKNKKTSSSELKISTLKIMGSTEWWYTDKKNNWYGIHLSEKESKEKTWLYHFLDIIILKIADILPQNSNFTGLCISSEGKIKSKQIKIPSRKQALNYIENLVQDMNNDKSFEFFPVESVFELSKEKMNEANYNKRFSEWMDEKLNSSKKHLDLSSKFGPIDFLEDIPYPENPYQIMERRFNLFFETISS